MVRGIGIKSPISDAGMQTYRQVKRWRGKKEGSHTGWMLQDTQHRTCCGYQASITPVA